MLARAFVPRARASASTSRTRALTTSSACLLHAQEISRFSPLGSPRSPPGTHFVSHSDQGLSSSRARDALRMRAPFSTTAQRRLDELPREYIQVLQQELLCLMHERPEILNAVKEYMQVVTDHGMDFPGHVLPVDMTYARLMQQKDLAEAGTKMIEAFLNAGVNVSVEVLAVSLMEMQHMVKHL